MNWYKRWLKAIALVSGMGLVAHAAFTVPTCVESYNGSGAGSTTQISCLDGNGNLTIKGGLTVNASAGSTSDGSFGANGTVTTTITGPVTMSAPVTLSSNTTTVGRVATTPVALTGLTGQTTWQIPVTSGYITMLSTGTNVPLTGAPTFSTATVVGGSTALPDGTYLVAGGTGCPHLGVINSSVTLQDDGTGGLTGTRLRLGAATRVISCNKSIGLLYDAAATAWKEVWYSNIP